MKESLSELWNMYIADQNVLLVSSITLSALSVALFVMNAWEAIQPTRIHPPESEMRWVVLRWMLTLTVLFLALVMGVSGWLESERIGTSVRALAKNTAVSLMVFTLLLHAVLRRADAWHRRAREQQ